MAEENKDKKYDDVMREAQYRKSRGIAWFNANNSAIEMIKYLSVTDKERIKELIVFWRNWFLSEYTTDYMENIANIGLAYNPASSITKLQATNSLEELRKVWLEMSEDERQNVDIVKVKNELRTKYEIPSNGTKESGVATEKERGDHGDKPKTANVVKKANTAGRTL